MSKHHTHRNARRVRPWVVCVKQESGQAVVEFAIVASLLLLLVVGIAQFGLALNTTNDETQLAGVAARYAAVNLNPTTTGQSFPAWVKAQADTGPLAHGSTVCVSFPSGTSNVGDPVQVTVSENFAWQPLNGLSALTGGALPASTKLQGSATMRLEAAPTVYSAGCA
jgi:Flp pilus assembly protein TadG